jgi:transcriptional regulator with XRE-family HTH domain
MVQKQDGEEWRRQFGSRLRELRQEQGMTQEAVAFRAGLSPNYVGDVERGERNLGLENIYRLADALGISPSRFFEPSPIDPYQPAGRRKASPDSD